MGIQESNGLISEKPCYLESTSSILPYNRLYFRLEAFFELFLNKREISRINWVVEKLDIFLLYHIILLFGQYACILKRLVLSNDESLSAHIFLYKDKSHFHEQLFILITESYES